jgi:hypothetical protein
VSDRTERVVGRRLQFDRSDDARPLKLLNIVDEYTREALTMDVERNIDADISSFLRHPTCGRAAALVFAESTHTADRRRPWWRSRPVP